MVVFRNIQLLSRCVGLNVFFCLDIDDELEVQIYSGVLHRVTLGCSTRTVSHDNGQCLKTICDLNMAKDNQFIGEDWDSECCTVELSSYSVDNNDSASAYYEDDQTYHNEDCDSEFAERPCLFEFGSTGPDQKYQLDTDPANQACQRHFDILPDKSNKVFISNISYRSSQRSIWKAVECFGEVQYCQLLLDRKGHSKGCAVVKFANEASAQSALNSSEPLIINNRELHFKPATRKVFISKHQPTVDSQEEVIGSTKQLDEYETEDLGLTSIHHLNEDSLLHIFSFLTYVERFRCERVCHRWRDILIQLWRQTKCLDLQGLVKPMQSLTDGAMENLLCRCSAALQTLTVDVSCHALTDRTIRVLAQQCPNLTSIVIGGGFNISNNGLQCLANGCRNLKSFTVHDRNSRLGEKGLWWLFHRCKELEHISLDGCRLKGQCLHVLGHNVKTLSLAGCYKLVDVGIEKIALRCNQIHHLNISDCSKLTDRSFLSISKFESLVNLNISGNLSSVTCDGLELIAQLHSLEKLNMKDNSNLTDDVLCNISIGCPLLKSLDISQSNEFTLLGQISDVGVICLADNCQHLSSINICNLTQLTDNVLIAFARNAHLTQLTARRCELFTDDGVSSLLSRCLNLEVVDVTGCHHISSVVVSAAVSCMSFRHPTKTLKLVVVDTGVDFPHNEALPESLVLEGSTPFDVYHDYFPDFESSSSEDEFFGAAIDDVDEFLDNDDVLAAEHWNLS